MNLRILSLLLGLVGTSSAHALTITTLSSDGEFIASYTPDVWTKAFGGSVRWGNNAAAGDWEVSVVNGADLPLHQRQGVVSGPRDFVFSFDSSLSTATLSVDGFDDSVGVVPGAGINTVMIRARASEGNVAALSELMLDLGGSVHVLNNLLGDSNANYLVLQDSGFAGDWSISGVGLLSGDASPRGSNPLYQFKVGTTASVPDAGASALLLMLGLGACAALRRRRA